MTTRPLSLISLALLVSLLLPSPAASQTRRSGPDDPLFRTIASLDREVFEAFNTCDLEKFGSLFAQDVEFYHDQGGTTLGRDALVASVKKNICGQTRRELIADTLEVHPMNGYGALQIGAHRFCDAKLKQCDGQARGVAKFIHLWQQRDGAWQITRVISYDHAPATK